MKSNFIQIFIHILNTGCQAGAAAAVIIMARFILNTLRVPKQYICLLWFIPFLRLALPICPQSAFSLLPEQTSSIPAAIADVSLPDISILSQTLTETSPETSLEPFPEASGVHAPHMPPASDTSGMLQAFLTVLPVLSVIWAVGICFFLLYGIACAIHLKKRLCMRIHKQDNIYLADGIPAAFVLGIFKPRIYLPSDISSEFSEYVICHEKIHIKRKDHITKLVMFILTCIYWFHPLIWTAYYFADKDIEFACDEAVIQSKSESYRQSYALALLSLSTHAKNTVRMPLAFSKGSPKKRIQHIISYKKPMMVIAAAGIAAIALLCAGLLTDPVTKGTKAAGANENVSVKINPSGKDHDLDTSSLLEVAAPVINLSDITGADGVRLYYADKNNIIFGGFFGLFVYSKTSQSIIRALDLKPIGCSYTQGDSACEVHVSKDGSTVYLHPRSTDEMYVYSTADNTLRKEPYDLTDAALYRGIAEDGRSGVYKKSGKKVYCMLREEFTIGSISWSENDSIYRRFFVPEGYENAVYFEPEDIHDLVKIEMFMDGKMRSVKDPAALQYLERNCSSSDSPVTAAACPFYDPIYLTRADGTIGIIYPASDSCSIIRTAGGFYKYSGTSQSFWALFGDWQENLIR